jgi:hypothetical protein
VTFEEKMVFLDNIRNKVHDNPSLFSEVVEACNLGLVSKIEEQSKQISDIETIAIAAISIANERFRKEHSNWVKHLIISKIEKWSDSSFFDWRGVLATLRTDKSKENKDRK